MIKIILRKSHNRELVKRGMSDNIFYKTIVSIYPKENSKMYTFYKDLLAKATVDISIETLFNIKLVLFSLTLIFYLAIINTNVVYQTDEILETMSEQSSVLVSTSTDVSKMSEKELKEYQEKKAQLEQEKIKEKEVYYILEEQYGGVVEKAEKEDMLTVLTSYIHTNGLNVKKEDNEILAMRMYQKLLEINTLRKFDWSNLLLLLGGAFFLPEMYFFLRKFIVGQFVYNEYLQLEVNTIMVGKLEPIKVEEILTVLSKNSKYFRSYIDEVRFNYFDVKEGYEDAFESVILKVDNKELKYLLKALQQASKGDLRMTIENLENQRISNKEFRNIKEQNKLKKKDLLGIVVVLVALAIICVYAFAPFGDILGQGLDLGFSV